MTQQEKGKPTLPGKLCKTVPLDGWTLQERYVWRQISEGEEANLDKAINTYKASWFNPEKLDTYPQRRILTPQFLETILLHEPYCSSIPHKGVRIRGARFEEEIDLSNAVLDRVLYLDECIFEANVNFSKLRTHLSISLEGSAFAGEEVLFDEAQIGGQLNIARAKFRGTLSMYSINVRTHISIKDGARFSKDVNLYGAKIGQNLEVDGSKFEGKLIMESIQVENYVFMRSRAEFQGVNFLNARIGTLEIIDSSNSKGKLNMDSIQVRQYLLIGNTLFEGAETSVDLIFAKISGDLIVSNSMLPTVDLSGAKIHGELQLASKKHPNTKWHKGAKLVLRNTEVGAIHDFPGKNVWPEELELDGFTYSRLGGFEPGTQQDSPNTESQNDREDMADRSVAWFKKWIEGESYSYEPYLKTTLSNLNLKRLVFTESYLKNYSPQPYEQLAKVLRDAGHNDTAKNVLYESKQRERRITELLSLTWIKLFLQWIFIGYGYRYRHTLYCAAVLVALGTFLIIRNPSYKITQQTLENLESENTPKAVIKNLESIKNQEFIGKEEFSDIVKTTIGDKRNNSYGTKILNHAIKREQKTENSTYNLWYLNDAFWYSFSNFLPLIQLLDDDKIKVRGCLRIYFYFHKLMGYILATYLIAGLSGLTKK